MRSFSALLGVVLPLAAAGLDATEAPIGVFDSGVGGLTVLEQLLTLDRVDNVTGAEVPDGVPDLQGESFVQLADMANLHYGSYAAAGPSGCVDLADAIQFGRPEAAEIARRYFRELVEELRVSASAARLRAVVFGCTHYPFMRKAFESALREIREDPNLSPYVDSPFAFVDPGVETAAECRAVLSSEGLLAHRRGPSKVSAFVSVPSAELPAERVGKDGTLEDGYKYSRQPGKDVVDTKFVPLDVGIADRVQFDRVIEVLPAVKRHLTGR